LGAPPSAQPPPPLPEDDFWLESSVRTGEDAEQPAPDQRVSPTAVIEDQTRAARGWTDLAVLDERADTGDRASYSARAHPLGLWLRGVEDQLANRWVYPPALRALGVQGTVVVRFRVGRDGSVSNVVVAVSSNIPDLDLAAVQAVPAALPPLPASGGRSVRLQYVFRYRESRGPG
jgi:TonB family protein